MANIDKIKRRLGIAVEDTIEDDLLKDLIDDAESFFKGLTDSEQVADKYAYIIEDVVYKLYVRKGSEGLSSESVDGYSVTYADIEDIFKPYNKILARDFGLFDGQRKQGKVLFR